MYSFISVPQALRYEIFFSVSERSINALQNIHQGFSVSREEEFQKRSSSVQTLLQRDSNASKRFINLTVFAMVGFPREFC